MAGAGKKTFTAGEVLTASDVNTYLMEQSVMYFAGTAARSSAIPTPTTGMTSYIGTTGTATIPQIETYTGAAWQTPYGMTLVSDNTFSGLTSFTVSNVFSSSYTDYKCVFTGNSSTPIFIEIALTASGVVQGAGGYHWNRLLSTTGSVVVTSNATSANNWILGSVQQGNCRFDFDLTIPSGSNALKSIRSAYEGGAVGGPPEVGIVGGQLNTAVNVDGLRLSVSSGGFSGNIKVYGSRKV